MGGVIDAQLQHEWQRWMAVARVVVVVVHLESCDSLDDEDLQQQLLVRKKMNFSSDTHDFESSLDYRRVLDVDVVASEK